MGLERSTFIQSFDFDCGSGSTQTILQNGGIPKTDYISLMQRLNTQENGTWPQAIKDFFLYNLQFKTLEMSVNIGVRELEAEVKRGNPVMVLYQTAGTKEEEASLQCGHYSVVDVVEDGVIKVLDPGMWYDEGFGLGRNQFSIKEFEERWIDRWTDDKGVITVLPKWMLSIEFPRHYRGLHFPNNAINRWVSPDVYSQNPSEFNNNLAMAEKLD